MKTMALRAGIILASIFFATAASALRAADTNPPPRLTIELRDGSRVVGMSVEKYLRFHSALLGDFKLEAKEIRALEFVATNSTKLCTANGDVLTVKLADSELAVKTSFGKVELAVDSLRKISVTAAPSSGQAQAGLVLFWSGIGDGRNNLGTDADTATELGARAVMVTNNAALVSMQETRQLTFEAWIKPNSIAPEFPVLLAKGGNQPGIAYGGYEFLLNANGDNDLIFASGAGMVDTHLANGQWINRHIGEWIHVAFTVNGQTRTGKFYVNGRPTNDAFNYDTDSRTGAEINFSVPNNLYIGSPVPGSNSNRSQFDGEMRAVKLFNRALTADEIQADYAAGHAD